MMTSKQQNYLDFLAKQAGLINWKEAVVVFHGKECPAHLITVRGASRMIDWIKSDEGKADLARHNARFA